MFKHYIEEEGITNLDLENELEDFSLLSQEESAEEMKEQNVKLITVIPLYFLIKSVQLFGGQKIQFLLTFSPPEIDQFKFDLPISLKGIKNPRSLQRKIICSATERPKIIFQPSMLQFDEVIKKHIQDK